MGQHRDTPDEQQRARGAVAEWRAQHPGATVEEMMAALAPGFHAAIGALLRGTWHLLAEREEREHQDAGSSAGTSAEDPASPGPEGSQVANAAAGVNGLRSGAGDGGAVASAPPSPRGGSGS